VDISPRPIPSHLILLGGCDFILSTTSSVFNARTFGVDNRVNAKRLLFDHLNKDVDPGDDV